MELSSWLTFRGPPSPSFQPSVADSRAQTLDPHIRHSRISSISSLHAPHYLCHRMAGNDRVISRFRTPFRTPHSKNSEQNGSLSPLRIPEGGEKITYKTSMKQETRGFATLPRCVANARRGLSSFKCSTNLCKEKPEYLWWMRCVSAVGVRFRAGA